MRSTRTVNRSGQQSSKIYQVLGAAAASLAILGLTACSDNNSPEGETSSPSSETNEEESSDPTGTADSPSAADPATESGGAPVDTAQAALRTAADAVENGEPFDLEVESHDGQDVFEVKVASSGNEFKVLVTADGLEVVSQRQKDKPSDDIEKLDEAQIGASEALIIAAQQEPDSLLDELEIDTEDGAVVWEVEFNRPDGSEIEYNVDVSSGEIEVD